MVVMYRVSKAVVMEAKLIGFKRPKFIALPNILLDRMFVPEFVQDEATPKTIASALRELESGARREAQLLAFEELNQILGPNDAITETARWILDTPQSSPAS